jgi:predicted ribosome quality control (RQC) complex YloA/Tae2 family protein
METEAPTETQEATLGETQAPFESQPEPPATETPEEPAGQAEGEEGPKVPESWDDLGSYEWFPDAHQKSLDAHLEERRPEIHKEAKAAAYKEFDPSMQRQEASLRQAQEEAAKMRRELRQLTRREDFTEQNLQDFVDDNEGIVNMLNNAMFAEGQNLALKRLADRAGDPNILPDLYLRMQNGGLSKDDFADEFLTRLTAARSESDRDAAVTKALEPKDKRIKELEAQLEQAKSQARGGEGSSRPQRRSKLTPEQRDALSAKVT